ncbi:GTP 3',8-cyclase MoaA [Miniimonas arenae]|uniref:GTP 3',8-cyclase MoaA n=1 Tax=Miniimonas arenae TaxID=676201 RepID=UPI0035E415E3
MVAVPVTIGRRPAPAPAVPTPSAVPTVPTAPNAPSEPLTDRFGRVHRDLRISLTDRCSLRCTYCMPEQGNEWLSRSSVLTTDEIVTVARAAAAAGITTFRLTGGEPLLRPDVVDVVARLAALRGPDGAGAQVAMTTNGIRLPEVLDALVAAGLARLNISLDTLDREKFAALTRRDRLDDVLRGVAAAQRSGLRPLKLNAVAMRGVNDGELVDLVEFAVAHDAQLRFIEQMPLDAGHTWDRSAMVTREEILASLERRWTLRPIPGRGGAPAERWRLLEGRGEAARDTGHTVGVIASVTAPFCGACDRLRLTADGQLRSCLFATDETDLVGVLRGTVGGDGSSRTPDGERQAAVDARLRVCLAGKRAGHGIDDPGFLQPARGMNAIGG